MSKTEPWFIGERAENAAILLLTEFDVTVERSNAVQGPDLHVTLQRGDKRAGLFVEVKGTLSIDKWIAKDGFLRPDVYKEVLVQGYAIPVAVMVVDVKSTDVYFGWILPPSQGRSSSREQSSGRVRMSLAHRAVIAQAFNDVMPGYVDIDAGRLPGSPAGARA